MKECITCGETIIIPTGRGGGNKKYCSVKCRSKRYYIAKPSSYHNMDAEGKKKRYIDTKEDYYKRTYGITIADWDRMFAEQKGCCAVCGTHQSNQKRSLAVDHCHVTGKVRALLCHHCNTGIGNLRDDVELLRKAIDYLEFHNEDE